MANELVREYGADGWQTGPADGGGGGSQDLAQVLAVGGDPDGNPITGAVTISPSDPTLGSLARIVAPAGFADDTEGDGTMLGLFSTDLGAYIAQWDIYGGATFITPPTFDSGTKWRNGDDSADIRFSVGDASVSAFFRGQVSVTPTTDVVALFVQAVGGATQNTFEAWNNTFSAGMSIAADGAALFLGASFSAQAEAVGFFGTVPVAQPVIPATPLPQDIADVLVALGLASQAP